MDFTKRIIFSTDRCNIRLFEEKDMASLVEYRNDMEWMSFQGFKGLTESEYKKTLLKEANVDKGTQLAIVNKQTDELIGDLYILKENKDFWLGYTISRKYARKGYAFEVVDSLIEMLSDEYRILAGVSNDNEASLNLLKKLGFTFSHTEDEDEIYVYNK